MFNKNLFSLYLLFLAPMCGAQTITTVAGDGTQGFAGDNGAPTAARLNLPGGVHGDTSGVLYIADTGNHRIRRIKAALDTITTFAGTGTSGFSGDNGAATAAQLNAPAGVFVDSLGNVYIADTGNHRVRRVSTAGTITTIAGTGSPGFSGDDSTATGARLNAPSAVYVRGGVVYIADTGNNRIRRVSTAGTIKTIAGTGVAGFSRDDTLATAAQLNAPAGVFVDSLGNVYIADTNNHRIRRVAAADSTISTVAGTGAPGFSGDGDLPTNARLAFPAAVFRGSDGSLYIADRFNHRIRRANPSGSITTLAGTGSPGFSGDGAAASRAQLGSPAGLFLNRSGTLFATGAANHRVRKISPDDSRGLSGTVRVSPGGEQRMLSVALTGDGSTTVTALTFTISDLDTATGLRLDDLVEFRLYESADDSLDGSDARIGALAANLITLGAPATIPAATFPTPAADVKRFYLVSARIARSAVQGRAFKVGFATGDLATSKGGRGSRVTAASANRMRIDAVATRLVFTRQPRRAQSGTPFLVQPVVTALNDSGFVDLDFVDTVTVSTSGSGTLLNNRVAAIAGVATFSALTYSTAIDDEALVLSAEDQTTGTEGDLPGATSDTLQVSTVNDPPAVDFPSLIMKEDDPIGFAAPISKIVSDPDDTAFVITFSSKHIVARVARDSIVVHPEPDWFGIDTLTVTATDPFGLQGSDQGIIEVTPVNDVPALALPDTLRFLEDDSLSVDLKKLVVDVDNDFAQLVWTFVADPGLVPNFTRSTGFLRLWVGPDVSGTFSLVATVRDPSEIAVRDTTVVIVAPVNDPPVLSIPDTSVVQDGRLVLDLRRFTTDKDHALAQITWSARADSLVSTSITPQGLATLIPAASFSGSRTLVFTARDSAGGIATDSVRLSVLRVNQRPVLRALPDTLLAPGDTLVWDLKAFAADPDDPPESLIWSLTGARRTSASLRGSVLTLRAPAGPSYEEDLVLSVTDLFGASASDTLRLIARRPPPLIAGVPDVRFEAGRIFELSLVPYLATAVSAVSAVADTALQVSINSTTRLATIAARGGFKGSRALVFRASAAEGRSSLDTIQVRIDNPPPVVSGLPELFVDAGESAQLSLDTYARDDEDLALLTWTAFPDPGLQVSIHAALRVATISTSPGLSARALVVLRATDAQGASGQDTLRVNIHGAAPDTSSGEPSDTTRTDTTRTDTTRVNRRPALVSIPPIELRRTSSEQLFLDSFVSDDGPRSALAWTAATDPAGVVDVQIDSARVATFTALVDSGQAQVRLRVTDRGGLSASALVQVRVRPPLPSAGLGDFDANGRIDLGDFFLFAEALGLTTFHPDWDPTFDLNKDGKVSFDDFFLFVDVFKKHQRLPPR